MYSIKDPKILFSLSELTPIVYIMELNHLGLKKKPTIKVLKYN